MTIDRMEYERRRDEWRGPLLRAAQDNPVIHEFIEAYAHGRLVTKEEALSQMVLALAKNWGDCVRQYYEVARNLQCTIKPPTP